MAGACGRAVISEGAMKKEKKGEMGSSDTARQLEEHNQKNTCILGSASLGYIHVRYLMCDLIGELKVCLF